jgi:hypothetical protein
MGNDLERGENDHVSAGKECMNLRRKEFPPEVVI